MSGQFQPLGYYGAQQTLGLGNLANWAENIATGGNVQTSAQIPQAGGTGYLPSTGQKTYAPLTATGKGVKGQGAQTVGQEMGGTGTGAGGAGTANPLANLNATTLGPFLTSAVGNLLNAQGMTPALQNLMTQFGTEGQSFLGQAANMYNQGQGLMGTGQGILGTGQGMTAQGREMLNQATSGTGLFPSQQALINQAVSSQQTAVGQQLASEGLGSSTLLGSLQGQAAMSGAAAAGQLIQGNIQAAEAQEQVGIQQQQVGGQVIGLGEAQVGLSQQEQGLGLQAQQLSMSAEQALFDQFGTISQLSSGMQAMMYEEAMSGYGAMNNMYNSTLGAFGYDLKSVEDQQAVVSQNAQNQLEEQKIQAQAASNESQGFSSMLGSLGSLLGGQGGLGGSGGLFGSGGLLGGLLGAGGGAAAAAGAGSTLAGTGAAAAGAAGVAADTGLVASVLAI